MYPEKYDLKYGGNGLDDAFGTPEATVAAAKAYRNHHEKQNAEAKKVQELLASRQKEVEDAAELLRAEAKAKAYRDHLGTTDKAARAIIRSHERQNAEAKKVQELLASRQKEAAARSGMEAMKPGEIRDLPGEELKQSCKMFSDKRTGGIKGVGKDAEVETLPNGAKHSRLDRAFHLVPALALSKVAEILHEGAVKYEPVELLNSVRANWRGIPVHSHVNHALQHLVAYLAEDTQDDHLGHAVARLMFALELREGGNGQG